MLTLTKHVPGQGITTKGGVEPHHRGHCVLEDQIVCGIKSWLAMSAVIKVPPIGLIEHVKRNRVAEGDSMRLVRDEGAVPTITYNHTFNDAAP